MFSLGKFLFPRDSHREQRRKLGNLLYAAILIAAVIAALLLLRASGR